MKNLSTENVINNGDGFQRFCHRNRDALNKQATCKKKHAWGNWMSFVNKESSKSIMTWTKFSNKIGMM